MDVAREMKSVRYRTTLKIRDMAMDAEARIYGMDPLGYRVAVLRAQELTTQEEIRVAGELARSAMEQLGHAYGAMYKSVQVMANDFARGFQQAFLP